MPAAPTDLTTVADFKLSQNVTGTADDQLIQKLITSATGWLELATRRRFVARRYNGATAAAPNNIHPTTSVNDEDYWYFDGDPDQSDSRGGLYYLPQYPVQANSVLAFQLSILQSRDDVSGAGDVWDTASLVEGRNYIVDRTLGAIRLLGTQFSYGTKNYRVKYAAGYALPAVAPAPPYVPAELSQACNELVNLIYRDRRNLAHESVAGWTRIFDTQKEDPFLADVVGNYTRLILV